MSNSLNTQALSTALAERLYGADIGPAGTQLTISRVVAGVSQNQAGDALVIELSWAGPFGEAHTETRTLHISGPEGAFQPVARHSLPPHTYVPETDPEAYDPMAAPADGALPSPEWLVEAVTEKAWCPARSPQGRCDERVGHARMTAPSGEPFDHGNRYAGVWWNEGDFHTEEASMSPALERKVIEEAYGVRIAPDVAPSVENTGPPPFPAELHGMVAAARAYVRESIDAGSISDGPARVALPAEWPIDVFLVYDDGNPTPADRVHGEIRGLLHSPAARTNTKAWAEFHPSTKTLNGLRSVIAGGGRTWLREVASVAAGVNRAEEVKAEFDGPDTVLLFELPQ